MKFPRLWPKDATSTFEKGFYAFVFGFAIILYVFVGLFSVWGVWGDNFNFLAKNGHAASSYFHIISFAFAGFTFFWTYATAKDSNIVWKSDLANVFTIVASMILSIGFACGFVFNG